MTSTPSTTAASAALAVGTSIPRSPACSAAAMAIDSAPLGGPGGAVEGQFAHHGVLPEPIGVDLSAAGQDAQGDGQVERGGLLGQIGRGQVDDHAVLRALEARVDDRPLDPVGALLDGRLRQPDQHGFRQPGGRNVDLHLHRQGVDAQVTRRF